MPEILAALAESAMRALGSDRASCYLCQADGTVSAMHTTEDDPVLRSFLVGAVGRPYRELPIWHLQRASEDPILVVEDIAHATTIPPGVRAALGIGAFIGVRMEHLSVIEDGEPGYLGAIFCSFADPREITDEDRETALGLAHLGGLALANARLYTASVESLARESVRAQENRAIVEGALDAVIVADADGTILEFNPSAEEMFGVARVAAVGRRVGDLVVPERHREAHRRGLDRLRAGMPTQQIGRRLELEAMRADGTEFPIELTLAVLDTADGPRYAAHIRDVTAQRTSERDLKRFAAEQTALNRVAAAVSAGAGPRRVFQITAREATCLLNAGAGAVVRFDADGMVAVALVDTAVLGEGEPLPADIPGVLARVRATGEWACEDLRDDAENPLVAAVIESGIVFAVAVPVSVGGALWGAISLGRGLADGPFSAGAAERLRRFADLVGLAIEDAELKERLQTLASVDPLTGLANHRAFYQRLDVELVQASSSRSPLSLVMFDIDGFKRVNETLGHQAGDEVVIQVAVALAGVEPGHGLLARVGGDKFAWILPQTDGPAAEALAHRARISVSGRRPELRLTISAGVCELALVTDANEMIRLADGALYWAKEHGRDSVERYQPNVTGELSPGDRMQRLHRSQAVRAMRALGRAVDARDPSTLRHAERVSELAAMLGAALGWSADGCRTLREAGLMHDVGKIGIPDAILFKPGRLTREEYEMVKTHAALSAEICAEALEPEQVGWVRGHHEWMDGQGYPDGLVGDAIPEGARILALADAWDVMTSVRTYSAELPVTDALAECRRCAGSQFWERAVAALEQLLDSGVPIPPLDSAERRKSRDDVRQRALIVPDAGT